MYIHLLQKKQVLNASKSKKNEIVTGQRSLDFHFFFTIRCFVPPVPKKKEFGHVPDTSDIRHGFPGGLSIGYLKLSFGQNFRIPRNRTGKNSREKLPLDIVVHNGSWTGSCKV